MCQAKDLASVITWLWSELKKSCDKNTIFGASADWLEGLSEAQEKLLFDLLDLMGSFVHTTLVNERSVLVFESLQSTTTEPRIDPKEIDRVVEGFSKGSSGVDDPKELDRVAEEWLGEINKFFTTFAGPSSGQQTAGSSISNQQQSAHGSSDGSRPSSNNDQQSQAQQNNDAEHNAVPTTANKEGKFKHFSLTVWIAVKIYEYMSKHS